MNIKKILQTIGVVLVTSVLLLVTTVSAVSANPYTGFNTIGSYWQYQYGYQGGYTWQSQPAMSANIQLPNTHHHYNYHQPPRAGGWFGHGTGWITGLRSPVYTCVEPVHHSSFSRARCGGGVQPVHHGGFHQPSTTTTVRRTSFSFGFY